MHFTRKLGLRRAAAAVLEAYHLVTISSKISSNKIKLIELFYSCLEIFFFPSFNTLSKFLSLMRYSIVNIYLCLAMNFIQIEMPKNISCL